MAWNGLYLVDVVAGLARLTGVQVTGAARSTSCMVSRMSRAVQQRFIARMPRSAVRIGLARPARGL